VDLVTSFDVDTGDTVNIDPGTNAAEKRKEVISMQNGYRLAHRLLKSKAKQAYGDATALSKYVSPHDIVLIGQILVHVRDPIAVIEQASKIAGEKIIIVEGSWQEDAPIAKYVQAWYPGTNSWWHQCCAQHIWLQNRVRDEISLPMQPSSRERLR
jgi:hypothetical protein